MNRLVFFALWAGSCWFLSGCNSNTNKSDSSISTADQNNFVRVLAADFDSTSSKTVQPNDIVLEGGEWLSYKVEVPATGRYSVRVKAQSKNGAVIWVEDYTNNKDDRTYDITGKLEVKDSDQEFVSIDGAPLQARMHDFKLHCTKGQVHIDWVEFELTFEHKETPKVMEQNMVGDEWKLVWSDEFEGTGLPDSTKWSYNVGNWGWGNNEPQYYTEARTENAKLENGNLIIEARKDDMGNPWTSARLTTQGKESFLYGRIEFRAKVPAGRGTWAAGWMLGDEYRDEVSWPYCGEIDVLECVGFEIDDSTGNGANHATCHTRAYYFKQGNQISNQMEVENMDDEFHTYAVEWYPNEIRATLDGKHYYTYDKNADVLEWPFDKPQNVILNLAVGGGWGGAQGIDDSWSSHKYIIDYVRVYELR